VLFYAANAHNWITLQAEPWIRIGLLAMWLAAAALVYFGALALVGIRWQKFLRHAK